MTKTRLAITAAVLGTGVALATASGVLAYRGDPTVQGPNCTPERHEEMTKAFENKDYQAWKENMQGRGRVTELINEDNFTRFAEMHRLRLEGRNEEADQIRTELGLGLRNGSGAGQGKGYGRNSR